jgi:hypothetical protein
MSRILSWVFGGLLFFAISLATTYVVASRSKRRKEWAPDLDQETARWSAKSYEELLSELREEKAYEVTLNSKRYTVEVELLENTPTYLHVAVAVDDGSLPASIAPLTTSFLCRKDDSGAGD